MKKIQTGFILYVVKYKECISFYKEILGLKILYENETLTCFDFLGSYLMVEIDDEFVGTERPQLDSDRTCIRINVTNVKDACRILDENSITYRYSEFDWGTIAKFRDPDGNLIGLRSAKEHQQLSN